MDDMSVDAFRSRLGDVFHLDEGGIDVTLTEVDTGDRDSFSLMFAGPAAPIVPQATYTFRDQRGGTALIFIVPLGPDASGAAVYQAVFSGPPPG